MTTTKSTVVLSYRVTSHLQNSIFHILVTTISYASVPVSNLEFCVWLCTLKATAPKMICTDFDWDSFLCNSLYGAMIWIVMKPVLTIHQCFSCCWAVLARSPCFPASEEAEGTQEAERGQNQNSWPKQIKMLFNTIWLPAQQLKQKGKEEHLLWHLLFVMAFVFPGKHLLGSGYSTKPAGLQEEFGQRSQKCGLIFEYFCMEAGHGLYVCYGSLSSKDVLLFSHYVWWSLAFLEITEQLPAVGR